MVHSLGLSWDLVFIIKSFIMFKFLLSLLFVFNAFALEVDEKLTCRILKASDSKKTILLNRGLEDGLVVGDHAKFFLTTGVIARGVMAKASPTRSIWSVYRIVDGSKIFSGKVLNLKISSPIKITEDEAKAKYQEEVLVPMELNGQVQTRKNLSQAEKDDIANLSRTSTQLDMVMDRKGMFTGKKWEVWGMVHINGLSSSNDLGDGNPISGSLSIVDVSLGGEKYFSPASSIMKNISLMALYHHSNNTTATFDGTEVSGVVKGFGGGLNWHLFKSPLAYGQTIWLLQGTAGVGSVGEGVVRGRGAPRQGLKGSMSFFSLGGGLKYFVAEGIGARVISDFYQRNEVYALRNSSANGYKRTVSGFRLMLGLSYRF